MPMYYSYGLGSAGVEVDDAGVTLILPHPAAAFVLKNTSETQPVYVVLNVVAVDDENAPTGVHPATGEAPKSEQLGHWNATAIRAQGYELAAQETREFHGHAPFNGGAQIQCIALAAPAEQTVTVKGGQSDVS